VRLVDGVVAGVTALDAASLERLLARLPVGVVSFDSRLRIEYLNITAAGHLAGAATGELMPDPWPAFSLRKFAARLFSETPPPRRVVDTGRGRLLELDGVTPVGGEHALLLLQDVTVRERHSRAERQFVANAAHELRTPVAAIASAVDVLQAGAKEEPPERDRFLGHIEHQSARLGRLAETLLLLAQIQTENAVTAMQLVEVRPLLEEVARDLDVREGVAVRVSCEHALHVLADPGLLRQALVNVAGNAARHTGEGEVVLAARDLGPLCSIEIHDTGSGMAELEQKRVFDRFYRGSSTRDGGYGLGLAITREIAGVLGGSVDLESELGQGTTVRLRLPAARIVHR